MGNLETKLTILLSSMAEPHPQLSFDDTAKAFKHKSNRELKETYRLFNLMKNQSLVSLGSGVGKFAAKLNIGFVNSIIRSTIFKQFCGGENLLDCQKTIDELYQKSVLTILDYGLEGKSSEEDFEHIKSEVVKCAVLAASNDSVPVVVIKMSALADNELLKNAKIENKIPTEYQAAYASLLERVDHICKESAHLGVGVFFDAEESWMQEAIDRIAMQMMLKYNKSKCIVYNTYQMYRHDRLEYLKSNYQQTQSAGVFLGAKIVRGAYMEKERNRAEEKGYESPIQATKADTDRDYNAAITFCIEHYEHIASCCATHNLESNYLQARLVTDANIDPKHSHINFCQLYGMSDYISYNLAEAGYNVAKYVPYGPIKEVIPYLIRRAKENSSVTGEMGRELMYLTGEMKRRKLEG